MCKNEVGPMAAEVKGQNLSDTGNTFFKRVSLALFNVKLAPISHPVQTFSSPKGMHACSVAQPCPILCDPKDCSPPGSSVHGILQARILERVATYSSRGSSGPRNRTHISCVSCIGRRILYHSAIWEALFKGHLS